MSQILGVFGRENMVLLASFYARSCTLRLFYLARRSWLIIPDFRVRTHSNPQSYHIEPLGLGP